MSQGRIVRMLEAKRARERYHRGVVRLAFIGLTGFLGVVFLDLFVVPLSGGKVELSPTVVSIEEIEDNGFPRERYLEVTGGCIVFSEADVWIMNEDDGLFRLTVPVISRAQWERWQESEARQGTIDASRFRLAVSFTGEQVGNLWPAVKEIAEAGGTIDHPPANMTITGDTETGKFMVNKPMQPGFRKENLDWARVRHLKFERHFYSLGRSLKNLSLAVGFLTLSVLGIKSHRRDRGPLPDGDLDPLLWTVDDVGGDGDLDID